MGDSNKQYVTEKPKNHWENQIYYGDWLIAADVLVSDSENDERRTESIKSVDEPTAPDSFEESVDVRSAIAKALGLAWANVLDDKLLEVSIDQQSAGQQKPKDVDSDKTKTQVKTDEETVKKSDDFTQPATTVFSLIEPTQVESVSIDKLLESWTFETEPMVDWTDSSAEELSPERPSLIHRNKALGVFSMSLSTEQTGRRPDIPAAINILAKGEFLHELPTRRQVSLVRGMDVLVDRSESMQPFYLDQDQTLTYLEKILGRSQVSTMTFWDDPFLGVSNARSMDPFGFKLPPTGRPILILSDVGLGHGLSAFDANPNWLMKLSAHARVNGNKMVVLSPIPGSVCPAHWKKHVCWLHWDRTLTSREVVKQNRHLV